MCVSSVHPDHFSVAHEVALRSPKTLACRLFGALFATKRSDFWSDFTLNDRYGAFDGVSVAEHL